MQKAAQMIANTIKQTAEEMSLNIRKSGICSSSAIIEHEHDEQTTARRHAFLADRD